MNSPQDVKVEAIGFRESRRSEWRFTRAWILNAGTRDVVWDMEDADSERKGKYLVEFTDSVALPRGDYEVFYSSFVGNYHKYRRGTGNFFGWLLDKIFDEDDYEDVYDAYRRELKQFRIAVRGRGEAFGENVEELNKTFNQTAFVQMTSLRDDEYERQGFELEKPLNVQVYAIGEARRDGTFDYGWIMDAESRETLWKFDYRDSEPAGGAKKNRRVRDVISLPAGRYVAFFVTDDSHSYGGWNADPPYDPMYWGLTLRVEAPDVLKYVRRYVPDETSKQNVILEFTRLRDNEFRTGGFTLKRDLDLRIYALGEGRRHEMFDYGWIIDARTHQLVWKMDYANTEHAGGGEKNRLFNGVVHFKKGSYIVYYVTDDSHSYWDWNTAPPFDKEHWGITIMAADKTFNPGDVAEYNPRDEGKILAQIVRVQNYDRERERFTLRKDSEVRIYAIGEGQDGSMYDYGWIENAATHDVVWEMTYRKTKHAGGARKNRLFDGTILLKKGEYIVYYETDDSHSFEDWNAAPPYDPVHWGITLYLVE
ncbi:MAG: hypothetical protein D6743_07010 [Calditrichaeota bacterium]|nr:MAG: hypothetical protein D6743_07010 [Calditrichota bacterium]